MVKKKTRFCDDCNKDFSNRSGLLAHVKRLHPDKLEVVFPKRVFKYPCTVCPRNFNHTKTLRQHQTKAHYFVFNYERVREKKCSLCEYNGLKSEIMDHLRTEHDLNVETECLHFPSMTDFLAWKSRIEKETRSFFRKTTEYKGKNYHRIVYGCHRSGVFHSKGTGKRRLKIQGSNKINAFCPAVIKVIKTDSTDYKTEYTKTHIGHDNDLEHLSLSKSDREMLASKMAAQIPINDILDEVRDSVGNSNIERLHLLTRKDLFNIRILNNLNKSSKCNNNKNDDANNTITCTQKMCNTDCILFYKRQGEIVESQSNLHENDFMLIIMNQEQCELLKKYGHDCICMDRTHELNEYGLELHTLLVLNQSGEGFPCCLLISNRSDEDAMKIFFACVKDKLNDRIKPKFFMSDVEDSYYNAWIQIMEAASFKLYSSWFVKASWERNLNKISKKQTQVKMFKQLNTLMKENDKVKFNIMLGKLLKNLSSKPATLEFFEYFNTNFTKNVELWADCYRSNMSLNTDIHIEKLHQTIKDLYLNGKHTKPLDTGITGILKLVRDKFFDEIINVDNTKIGSKVKDLQTRHIKSDSLNLNSIIVDEIGWRIRSSSSAEESYYIQEEKKNCNCQLVCPDCKICIHKYTCSCLDSSIRWNMCKHIHLLCKYLTNET